MLVTLCIIAVTSLVTYLSFNNAKLGEDLILWPPAISRSREYYRLVTYGLVHADVQHVFFNMLTLFFFGRALEPFFGMIMGATGFALFYIGALVVSVLPSYLQNRNNPRYRCLGASGAVSAVMFAFILLQPWSKIFVLFIPLPAIMYAVLYVAYSVMMSRQGGDDVNHGAHLWGAAYGVLFTLAMSPAILPMFLRQLAHPQWGFGF